MIKYLLKNKAIQIASMLLFMSLAVASQGFGQSFECSKASIPSEMAICNNEHLLLQDEKIGALLKQAVILASSEKHLNKIYQSHENWLTNRNLCRNDFACLRKAYTRRIQLLATQGFIPST